MEILHIISSSSISITVEYFTECKLSAFSLHKSFFQMALRGDFCSITIASLLAGSESLVNDTIVSLRSTQPTARVPDGVGLILVAALHALVHIGFGVAAGHQDLSQQGDVSYGQSQGVNLRQTLFVGKRRHVAAKLLEGRIDAEHPLPLPDVGGMPLHLVWLMRC